MVLLSEWVNEAGGLLHKRDLVARGARDRDLTRAVRDGDVRRVRRGWYTTFDPHDPRYRAVRVGGRLTGAAALDLLGAWMWKHRPPPVASVRRNAARLRRDRGVAVVYDPPRVAGRGTLSMVDPRDALVHAIVHGDFDAGVFLWDWALNSGIFSTADLDEVRALLPVDARGIIEWTDGAADSILESAARVNCLATGHALQSQVPISGEHRRRDDQRIDLVIDGTIALELDGEEHHSGTFHNDRLKDTAIAQLGLMPLRAGYTMVRQQWHQVWQAIEAGLAQHVRPRYDAEDRPVMASPPRVQAVTGRRRRRWRCRPTGAG